ncbi:hypothetical protein BJY52DRAFT_1199400 [Lactarius psammicola]|nr:hypothetical protein BJY52DRAFT_1199400 [Lactarius psammicola]
MDIFTPDPITAPTLECPPPSHVTTPDLTRGVASSMHNPSNAMVDDNPVPVEQGLTPGAVPVLPQLSSIPLLLRLAEMLNTLQANLPNPLPVPPPVPVPVSDPLPVPQLPLPPHSTHPKAILPKMAKWAGVVIPGNFINNQATHTNTHSNADIIGRTAGGTTQKGKGSNPTLIKNTEITIAWGNGLQDKAAEERLYKSNPGAIVQAAHSQMEHMSAQAPPVLLSPILCYPPVLQSSDRASERWKPTP